MHFVVCRYTFLDGITNFCFSDCDFSAAFFHGQVEQPVRGLMSLVNHKDISVLIAINERGVFIIDHHESVSGKNVF